jgi:dihydrofolate synthase/folylpolyglutamate synthase
MRFTSLPQWLSWQETLHYTEIDPGLERIGQVWQQMGGNSRLPFTVVTVAGTNGKGSTVATLAAILIAAGFRVGTYTSPHILRYNERICIDQKPSDDQSICEAFERIDTARLDISLTYFEYATLAAADIFCRNNVDIVVFEVGMGGRLDAVNLFDADIAVITPIGLDHTQWLGDTREKIGHEKAGILRQNHPVVCAESTVPNSVVEKANQLNCPTFISGHDFHYGWTEIDWHWQYKNITYSHLPLPALKGDYQIQNSAAVLQVCLLLTRMGHSISEQAIRTGLQTIRLSGRFQSIPGDVQHVLDVTHNEHGAQNLVKLLANNTKGRLFAILAMLADKECERVVALMNDVVDGWAFSGLNTERGQSGKALLTRVRPYISNTPAEAYHTVAEAHEALMNKAQAGDTILIFGSFQTVEAAIKILNDKGIS